MSSPTKLQQLSDLGQSIWIDNINRPLLESGRLQQMIADGLRGMTSNPTIFQKAIADTADYDQEIIKLSESGHSIFEIYDALTVKDVQDAADHFRGVYADTDTLDGYVSLEINPVLANSYEAQREEGLRLWAKVNRPNVMIKVPATPNGIRVFEDLIAEGVNVNVTLIFSQEQYQQVVWAYFKGLSRLSRHREDLSRVRSVASVFVSRIDSVIDAMLHHQLSQETDGSVKAILESLLGKAAVTNSEIIYDMFRTQHRSDAFQTLKKRGAQVQRVLWASTGTKNPQYSDVKYIEELIGPSTVNTVPDATLAAYLDHGQAQSVLPVDAQISQKTLDQLKQQGIDLNQICLKLLQDGVAAFEKSFEDLSTALEQKTARLCSDA